MPSNLIVPRFAFWMVLFATAGAGTTGCGSSKRLGLSGQDSGVVPDLGTTGPDRPIGVNPVGVSCVGAAECASGFCADGLCCQTACGGTCQSCALATSLGMCAPVPAGSPPPKATQCPVGNVSTCGLDGTCNGTGQCRNYESGTVCIPGVCEGDSIVNTSVCDGDGHCRLGASTVCAPFSCNSATNHCFSTCATDADCVSGRKCVNASCGFGFDPVVCTSNDECRFGHCADGACCNIACVGPCRSCKLGGLEGTCAPLPAGASDPKCPTCGLCDGFGGYVDASADGSSAD